jgi:hypothetical protein
VPASWHTKTFVLFSTFTLFPYDTVPVSSRKCDPAPNTIWTQLEDG